MKGQQRRMLHGEGGRNGMLNEREGKASRRMLVRADGMEC